MTDHKLPSNMKICVIYLFRKGDSISELYKFKDSYWKHKAGVEHDFKIISKNSTCYPSSLIVPDIGRELYSFRLIAKKLKEYDYFVFFNSHSEIIKDNWLRELVNLKLSFVGTSCSEESFYTNAIASNSKLNWLRKLLYHEYPNYHIRTNGFLIERNLMLKVWPKWLFTKQLCYLFESGKNNLTNRIRRLGYSTAVVRGLVRDNMSQNINVTCD